MTLPTSSRRLFDSCLSVRLLLPPQRYKKDLKPPRDSTTFFKKNWCYSHEQHQLQLKLYTYDKIRIYLINLERLAVFIGTSSTFAKLSPTKIVIAPRVQHCILLVETL